MDRQIIEKRFGKDGAKITFEVLNYLAKNPEAGDTLEGIVEWWLLEQEISREMVKVKKVLDRLVESGYILDFQTRDSKTYYKINPEKYNEVQALINE